eukprot:2802949-Prymnesium_polylepis.1
MHSHNMTLIEIKVPGALYKASMWSICITASDRQTDNLNQPRPALPVRMSLGGFRITVSPTY